MKVEQLANNQFIIRDNDKIFFQSYNSIIAKIENGFNGNRITLGRDWNYSTTTSKYLYRFLEQETKIYLSDKSNKRAYIEKLIKENVIRLDYTL